MGLRKELLASEVHGQHMESLGNNVDYIIIWKDSKDVLWESPLKVTSFIGTAEMGLRKSIDEEHVALKFQKLLKDFELSLTWWCHEGQQYFLNGVRDGVAFD